MKKLFLGLSAIGFLALCSFTNVETENTLVAHSCTYNLYSKGKFVGQMTIDYVPDNVSCESSLAMNTAIDTWNGIHGN